MCVKHNIYSTYSNHQHPKRAQGGAQRVSGFGFRADFRVCVIHTHGLLHQHTERAEGGAQRVSGFGFRVSVFGADVRVCFTSTRSVPRVRVAGRPVSALCASLSTASRSATDASRSTWTAFVSAALHPKPLGAGIP